MTQEEKIEAAFIVVCKKHHIRPTGQYASDVFDMVEAGYIAAIEDIKAMGPSIPEGWQLVPLSPTQKMIDALQNNGWMFGNYKAMLAAAPKVKP